MEHEESITKSVRFEIDKAKSTPSQSDTDSLASCDDSDHFLHPARKRLEQDALCSDASTFEKSSSRSNNVSYGSVQMRDQPSSQVAQKHTGCIKRFFSYGLSAELEQLLKLSLPLWCIELFQTLIGLAAILTCGHLSNEALAGVAIAVSVINLACVGVATGLSEACDTVFSLLYGNGQHKQALAVYLQRALLIIPLASLPCYALMLNIEPIIYLFGQHEVVSKIAADYILVCSPGLLAYFVYSVLAKFLQNQNHVIPVLLIGLGVNICNGIVLYVLVHQFRLGPRGAAASHGLSYLLLVLLTALYLRYSRLLSDSWQGWSLECLQHWGSFAKWALGAMVMNCVELWAFEAGVLIAAMSGMITLDANAVAFYIERLMYTIPTGLGVACSMRVGQRLGASDAVGARAAALIAIPFSVLVGGLCALLFFLLRNDIPRAFTNTKSVVELAAHVMPLTCVYHVFTAITSVCGGVLRGSGRQISGAVIVGVGHTIALCTGGVLLLHTRLQLFGFWLAMAAMACLESVLYLLIVGCTKWQNQMFVASKLGNSTSTSSVFSQEKADLLAAREKDFMASYNQDYSAHLDFEASYEQSQRQTGTRQKKREAVAVAPQRLDTCSLVARSGSVCLLLVGILAAGVVLRTMYY